MTCSQCEIKKQKTTHLLKVRKNENPDNELMLTTPFIGSSPAAALVGNLSAMFFGSAKRKKKSRQNIGQLSKYIH